MIVEHSVALFYRFTKHLCKHSNFRVFVNCNVLLYHSIIAFSKVMNFLIFLKPFSVISTTKKETFKNKYASVAKTYLSDRRKWKCRMCKEVVGGRGGCKDFTDHRSLVLSE